MTLPQQAPVDARIASLAARCAGIVDHAQLIALGLSDEQICRRLSSGRLHRLHRGVYAVGHPAVGPRGRRIAALRACGSGSLLADRSGAAHLGLSIAEGRDVHVWVPAVGRRSRDGVRVHSGELHPEDRTSHAGMPVIAAARILLGLATQLSPKQLDVLIAEAAHRGLLEPPKLARLLARSAGMRGVSRLRAAADGYVVSDRTRSVPEAAFMLLCSRHRIASPLVNFPIGDLEVDFFWPGARLIVEIDGFAAHRHRERYEGDRARAVHFRLRGYEYLPEAGARS